MNTRQLFNQIRQKKSFLCVGLDTDPEKIPSHLLTLEDPVFAFNRAIVDTTAANTIAYKPNLAFYESRGLEGWTSLERTVRYIRENFPDILLIADAKRGDIGNTSKMYASAFLSGRPGMDFDAVTVAPYMGVDSVSPFLEYPGKWVILLALTSNKGGSDFQLLKDAGSGKMLFEKVIETSRQWGTEEQLMYVVGATRAEMLKEVRKLVPRHFLLVPGVGAQGGSLQEVARYGMNEHCGLIVNSSRAILYADPTERFAQAAGQAAAEVQAEMEILLREHKLI